MTPAGILAGLGMTVERVCKNFKQVLISLDQLVYCLIGTFISIFNKNVNVYADLTISAQAYRLEQKGYWYGKALRKTLDLLFRIVEKEHCKTSYEAEKNNSHLPSDMH